MKLYLEKSKCTFDESPNGMVITVETDYPVIVSHDDEDFVLCQRLTLGAKKMNLRQPVILGSSEKIEL